MNVKHFGFLAISFLYFSCENTIPISLSNDYWEGEKIFVLAQLNVNSNAEVTIQNTFNPVIKPLPKKQILPDMTVFVLRDGFYFDSLSFDEGKNRYIGKKIIYGGHSYQIVIPQTSDTIKSQKLFFPDRQIKIESIETVIDQDTLRNQLMIKFNNFNSGFAKVNLSHPSRILMNSKLESLTKTYNSNCINNSTVDLKCLKDTLYCQKVFLQYFPQRYSILKTDSVFIEVEYLSPELELLINGNSSKRIEFSTNNPFKSSFTNAYGYFGYKISITKSKSLLD